MGLFSKNEDIPKIPTAPTLPELPKPENNEKKELPELPAFPQTSQNENINQETVKSAVTDNNSPEEKKSDENIQSDIHISEEPTGEPIIPPMPSEADSSKKTLEINPTEKKLTKEIEPIFVRIDKFQSAQKHFEEIKDKIKEIDSVIGKIKDTKSKEEVELKEWAEDVERIKSRLSEIDTDIFNQI